MKETQEKPESKKTWVRPQLIVLSRGTPEESVLFNCKTGGYNGPGAAGSCNTNLFCSTDAGS